MATEQHGGRNNMGTITTILGLAIFCTVTLGIMLRRIWIIKRYQSRNAAANAWMDGLGLERDEMEGPPTIAIGGRAVILPRPIMHDLWISSESPGLNSLSRLETGDSDKYQVSYSQQNFPWKTLLPLSLQLTTPHTTGSKPFDLSKSPLPNTQGSTVTPENRGAPSGSSTTNQVSQSVAQVPRTPTFIAPHLVQCSIFIALPNQETPTHPSFASKPKPPTSQQLPSVEIGVSCPQVELPSISVQPEDLEQWWDVPTPLPFAEGHHRNPWRIRIAEEDTARRRVQDGELNMRWTSRRIR